MSDSIQLQTNSNQIITYMKQQFKTLEEQVAYNQQKHKNSYSRIEGVVDRLIDLYEQAQQNILTGKDHRQVIEQLNTQLLNMKPLKTVRQHFVHYYRKLSNLIRKMQNDNKSSYIALSKYSKKRQSNGIFSQQSSMTKFNNFFDNFITEQSQKQALQKLIVQHFLREGNFECAKVWGNLQKQIDPNQLFNQCAKIKNSIIKGEFDQAITWCENQRLYQSHKNFLEYQLIKNKIIWNLEKGNGKIALGIYASKMAKFAEQFSSEIQKLAGFIMFKQSNFWGQYIKTAKQLQSFCNKRYADFSLNEQKLNKLAVSFQKSYLKQYDISPFDAIKIVYECASKINGEYARLMNLMWQSQSKKEQKNFTNPSVLPFSVKLQKDYLYHSLFLCPVTKQVHCAGETSIMLSCGHLISQAAQQRIIQESRNRRRVKCPVCQKQIKPQDSVAVQL